MIGDVLIRMVVPVGKGSWNAADRPNALPAPNGAAGSLRGLSGLPLHPAVG